MHISKIEDIDRVEKNAICLTLNKLSNEKLFVIPLTKKHNIARSPSYIRKLKTYAQKELNKLSKKEQKVMLGLQNKDRCVHFPDFVSLCVVNDK